MGEFYASLSHALNNLNPDVAEVLIKSGADLEPPCDRPGRCLGCSPLYVAVAYQETIPVAHLLLDRNVDVNKFCQESSCSVLHRLMVNPDIKLAKRILDRGVDTNLIFNAAEFAATVLDVAVEKNRPEAVQLILDYEVTDVNAVDPDYVYSALHLAVLGNSCDCMDALLSANPDVNLSAGEGRNHRRLGKENGFKLAVEMENGFQSHSEAKEMLNNFFVENKN